MEGPRFVQPRGVLRRNFGRFMPLAGTTGGGAPPGLILDSLTAGAAYSTRKLRTAYAGSALRGIRLSDNAELDIGFSGNALDTAALLSFAGASTVEILTWYDQSGNGRNISPGSTTGRPKIVISGTLQTINSKPALFFDGVAGGAAGDHLTNTSPFLYAAGSMTAIMVTDQTTATSGGNFFEERGAGGAQYSFEGNTAVLGRVRVTGRNDAGTFFISFVTIADGILNGTAKNLVFRDSGTQILTLVNGVATGSLVNNSRAGVVTLDRFNLGAQFNGTETQPSTTGRIAEAIFFASAISNPDMNAVNASQGGEYGITVVPFLSAVERLGLINGTGDGGQSLGINLEGLADFREPVYIDRARQARGWLNGTDFGTIPSANLSADGELASLPGGQTQAKFFFNSNANDPAGTWGGRFRLTFTGSATVNLSTAGTGVTTIDANTYEFDCDYAGDKWITFTPTAYPIKVSIVKTSDLTAHAAGQYFRTEFLDFIPTGACLRFMNPMGTNSSPIVNWADYPTISDQTWLRMPFLAMIQLCNEKSAHPWFCIPHQATDDFVTQMATVIRDNLNTGLRARIELSNEIWNFSITTAGNYFEAQALADWGVSGGTVWLSAAGKRFAECMQIFNTVFTGQTSRLIGVLAGHADGAGLASAMLDAPQWLASEPGSYVAPHTLAKEWSVAPYVGWSTNSATRLSDANAIKTQLDISHAAAVAQIKSLFPSAVATSKSLVNSHILFAGPRNLRITMYEYNNHYDLANPTVQTSTLWSGGSPVAGALDAFEEATYSAEMADALDELRDYFKAQNGSQMVLYKGPSRRANSGTWGVVQWIGQSPAPATYTGFTAWHAANTRWWAQ